jgi:hypothetical protein
MDNDDTKKTFLVSFDYGAGGLWFLVDANSSDEIRALSPHLYVVDKDPPWLERGKLSHWDIDNPPEGLRRFFADV